MKHQYEIILYWNNEHEAIVAEVPELAGCIADGADYTDALENVELSLNNGYKWPRI